jgi:hypothetical protein
MKRVLFLLALVMVLFAGVSRTQAQNQNPNFVDIRPTRYITDGFIEALMGKNIRVGATFKCGTNYRADWLNGAYVRLTGKAYIWTDHNAGIVHIHLFVSDPPMMLNGLRPPMTLNTADFNSDGTLVQGDDGYWVQYMRWRDRPCVDFRLSLLSSKGLVDAWRFWLQDKPVHKFQTIWGALGLDPTTGMPPEFLNMSAVVDPIDELPDEPIPQWAGTLTNLPVMQVEPGGEFETIARPTGSVDSITNMVQIVGAIIVGLGCLYVGAKVLS